MKRLVSVLLSVVMVALMLTTGVVSYSAASGVNSGYGSLNWKLCTPSIKGSVGHGCNKISWNEVPGAEAYRVFYKVNGSWKKLADFTSRSNGRGNCKYAYTHKINCTANSTNIYTVRCISANKRKYTSDFNRKGVTCVHVAAPTIKQSGSVISWNGTSTKAVKWQILIYNPSTSKYEKLRKVVGRSFNYYWYYNTSKWSYKVIKNGKSKDPSLSSYYLLLTVRGVDAKGNYCTDYNDFWYNCPAY